MLDIERARHVITLTKGIHFTDGAFTDARERLSLLTVASRVRPIALFLDFEKAGLQRLKDLLINIGFVAFVGKLRSSGRTSSDDSYTPEVVAVLKRYLSEDDHRALWVCNSSEDRQRIRNRATDFGALLGYPECCVHWDQQAHDEFVAAIVRASHGDAHEVERHLKQNIQVGVTVPHEDNVPRTERLYPFVMHIACDSCLGTGDSPSSLLNQQYQSLVRDVDALLHDVLLQLGEKAWRIHTATSQDEKDILFAEAESIYLRALA